MFGWTRDLRLKGLLAAAVLGVLVGCAAPAPTPAAGPLAALPDGFPNQPIIITGGSPGNSTDVFLRAVTKATQAFSPVPLVVENVSGSVLVLRMAELAMDKAGGAEGYFLFNNSFSGTARAFGQAPAKAKWSDVGEPLFAITDQYAMYVRTDSPFKSVGDFVKYAKENPGQALIGGGEPGGLHQVTAETFARKAGFQYTYVPHTETAAAVITLIGGGVDVVLGSIPATVPQVKEGKVRPIGVSSSQRSGAFPEVPTFKEQGYDVALDQFRGGWVLASVAKERVQWLRELFRRGMETAEFKQYVAGSGEISQAGKIEEFAKEQKALIPTIEDTVRALGLHYETAKR
ncbi:MAG: tripartite tricarboxylate transporter substrate binding protein [Chloroflexi bacterium]|nr:tripartite tricarboxylate transporter substrate binding protein [Chloroflexota bacterium]